MKLKTMTWPVLTVAILGAAAFAADTGGAAAPQPQSQSAPAEKPSKRASLSKYSGTVESVDAAANKVSVKNKKGEVKDFTIGADAKLTRGGKAILLSDIAGGDTVTVSYDGSAGGAMAKSVMVAKAHQHKRK